MIDLDREWRLLPARLVLASDEVHVWRLALEQPSDRINMLARLLSLDEQTRVDRFHFEHDRRRFIVSHGSLRQILGRYLNLEPNCLRFDTGTHGKPYLAEEFSRSEIHFNLTHSHELALCAITRQHEIGIDLEHLRPLSDMLDIAARYFSTAEYLALCSLPESQKLQGFFNCWTCKEAYLKATGGGLAQGLDHFQVSLKPDEPPQLLAVASLPAEIAYWSLISLNPAPQYTAALVISNFLDDHKDDAGSDGNWHVRLYSDSDYSM